MSGAGAALSLQGAIITALKADVAVMAIAKGIHDRVPVAAALPYVHFRSMDAVDDSVDCIDGYEITVDLDVWSDKPGLTEAARLADAINNVLDEAELSLTGYRLVELDVRIPAAISRDADGVLSRASVQLRALVDETPAP